MLWPYEKETDKEWKNGIMVKEKEERNRQTEWRLQQLGWDGEGEMMMMMRLWEEKLSFTNFHKLRTFLDWLTPP